VQADTNYRQADGLVSMEASRIDQLDRLLARYGDPKVAALRPLLHDYTQSVVEHEWPAMLTSFGHADTIKTFAIISNRILAVEPTTPRQSLLVGEMLRSLDATTEARAARLNAVTFGLPSLYWEVVACGLIMLISVGGLAANTRFRTFVLGAQLTILGLRRLRLHHGPAVPGTARDRARLVSSGADPHGATHRMKKAADPATRRLFSIP
jgi:hypothetical protein